MQQTVNQDQDELIHNIKTRRAKVWMHCISQDARDYVRELEDIARSVGSEKELTEYQKLVVTGVCESDSV